MKPIQLYIVVLFLILSFHSLAQKDIVNSSSSTSPATTIGMGKFETFTLDNGLKVIVVENHQVPELFIQVFIDVPPLREGANAGLADMTTKMLHTGTTSRNKSQIQKEVEDLNASLSTHTNGLHGTCLTKDKVAFLEILSDVLLHPSFPQAELDALKTQALSRLTQDQADPKAIMAKVAKVLRFGKEHPYGEVTTEKSIESLTVDLVKKHYQKYFRPSIAYLVVVGNIHSTEAKQLINQYFGKWEKGLVMQEYFEKPRLPAQTEVNFVDIKETASSMIAMTYPVILKPKSDDIIPSSVMNTLLNDYLKSRINEHIRAGQTSMEDLNAHLQQDKWVGYFSVCGRVTNEMTDSILEGVLHELHVLRDQKPSLEALDSVKNVMARNFMSSLQKPETVARFALNQVRDKLPQNYYETYVEKLSQVTPEAVQMMAQKYLLPEQAHLIIVGHKDELAERLARFSADKKVKFFDADGKELVEKKKIVPERMEADH